VICLQLGLALLHLRIGCLWSHFQLWIGIVSSRCGLPCGNVILVSQTCGWLRQTIDLSFSLVLMSLTEFLRLSQPSICVFAWGRRLGRQTNVQGYIYCIYVVESLHGCTCERKMVDGSAKVVSFVTPLNFVMIGGERKMLVLQALVAYRCPSLMDPRLHRCNIDGWEARQFLFSYSSSLSAFIQLWNESRDGRIHQRFWSDDILVMTCWEHARLADWW
jgi:hypothetical protein